MSANPAPSIADRMKAVIQPNTNPNSRFKELEEMSGINAASWKAAWHGNQRPTAEMIEHVARLWPQHAFWLATGELPEPQGIHLAPPKMETVLVPHGSAVCIVNANQAAT